MASVSRDTNCAGARLVNEALVAFVVPLYLAARSLPPHQTRARRVLEIRRRSRKCSYFRLPPAFRGDHQKITTTSLSRHDDGRRARSALIIPLMARPRRSAASLSIGVLTSGSREIPSAAISAFWRSSSSTSRLAAHVRRLRCARAQRIAMALAPCLAGVVLSHASAREVPSPSALCGRTARACGSPAGLTLRGMLTRQQLMAMSRRLPGYMGVTASCRGISSAPAGCIRRRIDDDGLCTAQKPRELTMRIARLRHPARIAPYASHRLASSSLL